MNWSGWYFEVYDVNVVLGSGDDSWPSEPGVYIFVKQEAIGSMTPTCHPLYIGETENFSVRFQNHEKIPAASQMGLNQIHLHGEADRDRRLHIEAELKRLWEPPLNR